jgi:hypothetical protein
MAKIAVLGVGLSDVVIVGLFLIPVPYILIAVVGVVRTVMIFI